MVLRPERGRVSRCQHDKSRKSRNESCGAFGVCNHKGTKDTKKWGAIFWENYFLKNAYLCLVSP
jgi:hypothetical protein